MPQKDAVKRRATWKRWYYRNRETHIKRVRALDARYRLAVRKYLDEERAKGCTKCPMKHPAAIDFHHIVGKKELSIGLVLVKKWCLRRVQAEVAKCIRLCANCHRIHHFEKRKRKKPSS